MPRNRDFALLWLQTSRQAGWAPAGTRAFAAGRRYDRSAFGRPAGATKPKQLPGTSSGRPGFGFSAEDLAARFANASSGHSGPLLTHPWLLGLAASAGGLYALHLATIEPVPATKRSHHILYPVEWEAALGKAAIKGMRIPEAAVLPSHAPAAQRVTRIVQELTRQVSSLERLPRHRADIEWKVMVVNDGNVNAFAAPGGQIVIFTGLLHMLPSDEEVAAVIAHEMAHVLARHSAEELTHAALWAAVIVVINALAGGGLDDIAAVLQRYLFALPNSRAIETEADAIGMDLAARACYDPQGMADAFTKMEAYEAAAGGDGVPEMLRTHPLSRRRIEAALRRAPAARQRMEAHGCHVYRAAFFEPSLPSSFGADPEFS